MSNWVTYDGGRSIGKTGAAGDVGAGERQCFSDVVHEQRARLDVTLVDRPVDGD